MKDGEYDADTARASITEAIGGQDSDLAQNEGISEIMGDTKSFESLDAANETLEKIKAKLKEIRDAQEEIIADGERLVEATGDSADGVTELNNELQNA